MTWIVYLSGEIHTDWRQQIADRVRAMDLPVVFSSAVTDHAASDAAGDVLGEESDQFWRDHKSAKVNGIRTRTLLDKCDIAVVRFERQVQAMERRVRRRILCSDRQALYHAARRGHRPCTEGSRRFGNGMGENAAAGGRHSELRRQSTMNLRGPMFVYGSYE